MRKVTRPVKAPALPEGLQLVKIVEFKKYVKNRQNLIRLVVENEDGKAVFTLCTDEHWAKGSENYGRYAAYCAEFFKDKKTVIVYTYLGKDNQLKLVEVFNKKGKDIDKSTEEYERLLDEE